MAEKSSLCDAPKLYAIKSEPSGHPSRACDNNLLSFSYAAMNIKGTVNAFLGQMDVPIAKSG